MRTILKGRNALACAVAAFACAAACDTPPRDLAKAAPATAAVATSPTDRALIPGTPAGDLEAWVTDIRAGIAGIPDLAAKDPAAAQRKALDLYVTRQEYAEMYFGVAGRQRQDDALAAAIDTAEMRFHDLMQLLSLPHPDVDELRAAVAALDARQATVTRHWRRTGARLHRAQRP